MATLKNERVIRRSLVKFKAFIKDKDIRKASGEWRTAFDEGVVQALSWVLGEGKDPATGFELRFRRGE